MSIPRHRTKKPQLSETTLTGAGTSARTSPSRFDNLILRSEIKEAQYILHKSQNLQITNEILKAQNQRLLSENQRLLILNSEYLQVVNKHYEDRMNQLEKVLLPSEVLNSDKVDSLLRDSLQKAISSFKKLENDHKQLIKHCAIAQKQNTFLKGQLQQLKRIKRALAQVNHNDVFKLVKQMKEIERQNQDLRKSNNDKCYCMQKQKLDLEKLTNQLNTLQAENQKNKRQLDMNRARVNKMNQELKDKDDKHMRKTQVLEAKCSQFQRFSQQDAQELQKNKRVSRRCQIQNVQYVRTQNNLQATIDQLMKTIDLQNDKKINQHRRMSCSVIRAKSARSARNRSITQHRSFL